MNKKIVVFGGGTGISYLLKGLNLFPLDITAVISVSDNGSSTGKLRKEFLMPAMGDIRKVITSLSDVDTKIKDLLEYRFNTYSDLNGHPIGNLIMTAMYNMTGNLKESIEVLTKFLNIKHKVLPLSEDYLTLMGETTTGKIIEGEENITKARAKYKRLYYKEEPKIEQEVMNSILSADLIILSMGSLYTSILPHLISKEINNALDKTKCPILYTCNAVTQPGETEGFKVSDHIKTLNKYLNNRKIDVVIAPSTQIPEKIVKKYETKEQKDLVKIDKKEIEKLNCELIKSDNLTIENNMIRHDSLKLANTVFNYLMRWNYVIYNRSKKWNMHTKPN